MPVRDLLNAASGASAPSDPYFYDVSLLLNGDGTNGAQNNTFLDSSSNNFTITRNGNTTQGTFSPYGNLWSNYFSSSRLSAGSSSAFGMGTGDFTIEAWIFATSAFSGYQAIFADNATTGGLFFGNTTGGFGVRQQNIGNIVTATAPATNQWVHVAVSRSGTTISLFYNGVQQASATNSTNFPTQTGYIGDDGSGAAYFSGYISNFRLVKGTALYTSNFTPSTTPLTAVSGTSLLTCQSNRFIDNSSNNFAISVSGSPSVQRFSPFNPTSAYSTATIGGSGYTDSSSDLSIAYNSALNFGSNDFTIEGWWYAASQPTNEAFWAQKGGSQYFILQPSVSGNNKIALYIDPLGAAPAIQGTTTLVTGTWYHVALVRKTNVFTLYLNGVQEGGTYTNSGNPTPSSGTTYINGQNYPVAAGWNGYVCDFRIVNGTAVYTSSFTPPTAPLTNITNTALLCNMTNAGIPDLAMQNDLQTVGSAQVSTSVKKYGTGSLYFDGSTAYLPMASNPIYAFVGQYTIEFWAYITSTPSNYAPIIYVNVSGGLQIGFDTSNGKFGVARYLVAWDLETTAFSQNQWVHVAITRDSSNTTRIFYNGVQQASATLSYSYPQASASIGGGNGGYLPGYIDDLRITNGYARYTANFTPPTSALPTY